MKFNVDYDKIKEQIKIATETIKKQYNNKMPQWDQKCIITATKATSRSRKILGYGFRFAHNIHGYKCDDIIRNDDGTVSKVYHSIKNIHYYEEAKKHSPFYQKTK